VRQSLRWYPDDPSKTGEGAEGTGRPCRHAVVSKQAMTTNESTPTDGENVTERSAEDIPVTEVSGTVPNAGVATVEVSGCHADGVDVLVVPVREPTVSEDVTVSFGVGQAVVDLSLSEDDALALMDAIQQALEVERFEG